MTRMIQLVLETKNEFNLADFLKDLNDEFLKQKDFFITSASVFEKKGKIPMSEDDDD